MCYICIMCVRACMCVCVCVCVQDICKDPKFFTGGASRFDVSQGILGDCWLVAAIASLTQDAYLLKQVRDK